MATAKKSTTKKTVKDETGRSDSTVILDRLIAEGALTMGDKLKLLYILQQTDSKIDKIHLLRGELPLEVQGLEDDIEELKLNVSKLQEEIKKINDDILKTKHAAEEAANLVAKYESQQNNVKNSREFDSISKEIEFQNLSIELYDKKVKDFTALLKERKEAFENARTALTDREADLKFKKQELDSIVEETAQEEQALVEYSQRIQDHIDKSILAMYKKVRANAHNGLAVVTVNRDACGGCFNKIPPQRQLDIRMNKKIIVCEYCGRILVDNAFEQE